MYTHTLIQTLMINAEAVYDSADNLDVTSTQSKKRCAKVGKAFALNVFRPPCVPPLRPLWPVFEGMWELPQMRGHVLGSL